MSKNTQRKFLDDDPIKDEEDVYIMEEEVEKSHFIYNSDLFNFCKQLLMNSQPEDDVFVTLIEKIIDKYDELHIDADFFSIKKYGDNWYMNVERFLEFWCMIDDGKHFWWDSYDKRMQNWQIVIGKAIIFYSANECKYEKTNGEVWNLFWVQPIKENSF